MAEVPAAVLARYSRRPDEVGEVAEPADEFLRLACLAYGTDDGAQRWVRARAILAAHHDLADGSAHVAAAVADVASLQRILAEDRAAASRDGGPFGWTPLCYLAYARHDPDIPRQQVLESARLLLDAGADPNDGYLWHDLASPFTALTGAFGEGEGGPARQPRHPHSLALARLLLAAGADANDPQALYNRMFGADDSHLELLLEFGLGHGDGGPWRARLGDAMPTPADMVRGQLAWAIMHGMAERARLLVERGGPDLAIPPDPQHYGSQCGAWTQLAATSGHLGLVDFLVAHGAPPLDMSPAQALIAVALTADRGLVNQLGHAYPGLLDQARTARPALIVWAAACGSIPAVELLAELGWDVNALGRADIPSDQPWQTALHAAAEHGNLDLAKALLRLGADPTIKDARFDGTPLDWARYLGQDAIAEFLATWRD